MNSSFTTARRSRTASAPGSARRRALGAALTRWRGGDQPSIAWRRDFSLLSGGAAALRRSPSSAMAPALGPPGRRAVGDAGRADGRAPARPLNRRNGARRRRALPEPEIAASAILAEDEDRDVDEQLEDERRRGRGAAGLAGRGARRRGRSRGAARGPQRRKRFWFEHATGAGKTVAALGFVEASRTGGVLILTHRRNLVDQFLGELRDRGYRKRIAPALLDGQDRANGRSRSRPTSGSSATPGTSPTPTRS